MALDLKKVRQEVGQTGKDLTKPSQGGGDFAPPDIGPTRLRLVAYIETGVHKTMFKGAPKIKPRAELTFELSGPKHPPKKLDDGTLIPFRITVKEVVGTTPKNGYIKLFNILNVDGDATNFVDLMMEKAWRGTVSHYTFKGQDGNDRTIAQLKKDGAYQIAPTAFEDPETGETRDVAVPPAVSEPRLFLWDNADLDQWDSLLDFQKDKIRKAENFTGSPVYLALAEAGREAEFALSERGAKEAAAEEDEPEGEAEAKPGAASLTDPEPEPVAKKPGKAPAGPAKASKPAGNTKAAPKGADPLQGLD